MTGPVAAAAFVVGVVAGAVAAAVFGALVARWTVRLGAGPVRSRPMNAHVVHGPDGVTGRPVFQLVTVAESAVREYDRTGHVTRATVAQLRDLLAELPEP